MQVFPLCCLAFVFFHYFLTSTPVSPLFCFKIFFPNTFRPKLKSEIWNERDARRKMVKQLFFPVRKNHETKIFTYSSLFACIFAHSHRTKDDKFNIWFLSFYYTFVSDNMKINKEEKTHIVCGRKWGKEKSSNFSQFKKWLWLSACSVCNKLAVWRLNVQIKYLKRRKNCEKPKQINFKTNAIVFIFN